MIIASVIPIAKGISQETLSYFSSKNIQPGALVTVQVRKKIEPAIVFATENIKDVKASLKKTEFKLKPVKSIKSPYFLRPEFVEACAKTAKHFVSPVGAVIKDFIPQTILEKAHEISTPRGKEPTKNYFHTIFMQAPNHDRLQYYKSIIREEFAKNNSVFFCMPTVAEIEEMSPELKKGIEKYAIILHNKLSKKKIIESWKQALKENHPILIIATKSFLSLPRKDISVLIIDCESSPHYKITKRPYVDARKFAEILCEQMKIRLIAGDYSSRSETFHKAESSSSAWPSRLLSEAEQIIVDMNKSLKQDSIKSFSVLSEELKNILGAAMEKNEKIILLAGRRGHSPITICNDCRRTILCDKCDTPLTLHKIKSGEISYICHKCLSEKRAPEQCPYCQSWRLETIGIDVQKIAEEIEKTFPKFRLFIMDSDTIENAKQGKEMADLFLASAGSILIGTEIIFSFIRQAENPPVDRAVVISIDNLFALPDFRVNEKIFNLLLKTRALAQKTFIIQTRLREKNIFEFAARGNVSGFYKSEIENRKQFQYPPFKILIKITKEGKNNQQVKKEIQDLEKILAEWQPFCYQAFTPKMKNLYSWHILLKIDPELWPEKEQKLHKTLSSLSLSWKINIDPESLL